MVKMTDSHEPVLSHTDGSYSDLQGLIGKLPLNN